MSSEEKPEDIVIVLQSEEVVDNDNDEGVGRLRLWCICELLGCLTLFATSLIVEYVSMPQNVRDIPVQEIKVGSESNSDADSSASGSSSSVYIRNLMYNEEYGEDTIRTVGLVLLGLVLPFLLQLALPSFGPSLKRRPYDRYNTLCSYLLSISITFLIVDILKLYCGNLRPHFYAVCIPDEDTYQFCTNEDEKENREIRDSFPSGHAGLSMLD